MPKLDNIKLRGTLFSDITKQVCFTLADVTRVSRELNVVEVEVNYVSKDYKNVIIVTDVIASTGYEDAKGEPIFHADHLKDDKDGKYYVIDSRGDILLIQYEPIHMARPFDKELASKLTKFEELHPYQKKR